MATEVTPEVRAGERRELLLLLLLAAIVAAAFLMNQWVHDDAPRILYDRRVHDWNGLWRGFVESYWPPPSKSGLFRPLATTSYTIEWWIGNGSILAFRICNLILYVASVWGVWALARRLLPAGPAWLAGALFAVHPLHTEVLAVSVNQSETVVALIAVLSVLLWLDLIEGKRRTFPATLGIIGFYLVGLGFKENALVLPGLLLAAELLRPEGGAWRERLRRRGGALALILAVGVVWWTYRAMILGDLAGAAAAEGLRDETFAHRMTTMFGVVPIWARLFFWPATLRADYSPRQIDPDLPWGDPQITGAFLLIAWGVAFVIACRRDRTVAFALAWIAIAIAPVANVLLPTGILVAERTLFLPSIGVAVGIGALATRALPWWHEAAGRTRGMSITLIALLLGLGVWRDWVRAPDWYDADRFVETQLRDSPLGWRAHTAYGIWAFEAGYRKRGEYELQTAIQLWPHHARPYHLLADYYRADGLCEPALAMYAKGLEREPDRPRQRLSAVACYLWLGRYAEAATTARGGSPTDRDAALLADAAAVADSAARSKAPAHSVRLPPLRDHASEVGWRIP